MYFEFIKQIISVESTPWFKQYLQMKTILKGLGNFKDVRYGHMIA